MKSMMIVMLFVSALVAGLFVGPEAASAADEGKILIAYFSRADENYQVGYVTKGNTQIIAEAVAEATGGDMYRIETETPYPKEYKATTDIAKREQNENARPKLKTVPPDTGPYSDRKSVV